MGFEFVCVLSCELCGSMVDVRNPSIFAKNNALEVDNQLGKIGALGKTRCFRRLHSIRRTKQLKGLNETSLNKKTWDIFEKKWV